MNISYNGKDTTLSAGATLTDLLVAEAGSVDGVLVELNGEVLESGCDYSTILLNDGDEINGFRIVAGG